MKQKNITFRSTRNKKLIVPFWQSIIQGMAEDGGLLVPNDLPKLPSDFFKHKKNLSRLTVSDVSFLMHRFFIPESDISDSELKKIMRVAHNFEIPLESLDDTTHILRIDRGPTASFKDVAARSLAQLIEKYCEVTKTPINILVATSGDTGVAIADAFGNSKYVSVTVLYPTDGVSEIQEKQMLEVHQKYSNEQVIPIKGNFDNCQDVAKILQSARYLDSDKKISEFIKEAEIKLKNKIDKKEVQNISTLIKKLNLSSANSINIWRLTPQMTQYVVSYIELVRKNSIKPGEEIVISIPTGNVGHLMAGIYAKELGLPIKKFIVGTNANNILANIIGSGLVKHRRFVNTSSPSMDILDPSNLERLLSYAREKTNQKNEIDFAEMKYDIKKLTEESRGIELSKYGVSEKSLELIQKLIWAEDVETDEEIYAMMQYISKTYHVILEPHGTTGLIATIRARSKNIISPKDHVVIFETAHPDKFPTALKNAGTIKLKRFNHAVLERLKKIPLKKFNKPKSVDPKNLLEITKKISKLAK